MVMRKQGNSPTKDSLVVVGWTTPIITRKLYRVSLRNE